ncbi:fibroblast growth factor receptor 3-like isoform X3 [Porites lutea]|uniref:fibroblast growth factor receptor 3-like isoform X3 n=1 Tax=Porites lutea TaxID=51062 RepID=UPI003CC59B1E
MDINHATPEMTCLHRHSLDSTFILLVICGSIGLSAQQSGDPTVQSRTNITGEKPKFVFPDLIRKTKKELRAGDKFELTCEAIGKPTPIVTWYKDGKIYERFHDGQKPGPHDYQLEFNGLDIADSGSYMCNVSNELGFLTLTYNLTVQDLIRSQPNILIIWEQKSPIYVGQNVEIFCTIVTKDPNTKYHWYHSDTNTIPNDENLGVLIDPRLYEQPAYNGGDEKLAHVKFTLTLQNVTIDQSGLYGCQAENRIGYESRQTNLTVTHRSIIIPPVFADIPLDSKDTARKSGDPVILDKVSWILLGVSIAVFVAMVTAFAWLCRKMWKLKMSSRANARGSRHDIASLRARYDMQNEYVVVPNFN